MTDTGYIIYKRKSNPDSPWVLVPEEYDKKAREPIEKILSKLPLPKGKRELAEDRIYFANCIALAFEERRYDGSRKEQGEKYLSFFTAIFKSLNNNDKQKEEK